MRLKKNGRFKHNYFGYCPDTHYTQSSGQNLGGLTVKIKLAVIPIFLLLTLSAVPFVLADSTFYNSRLTFDTVAGTKTYDLPVSLTNVSVTATLNKDLNNDDDERWITLILNNSDTGAYYKTTYTCDTGTNFTVASENHLGILSNDPPTGYEDSQNISSKFSLSQAVFSTGVRSLNGTVYLDAGWADTGSTISGVAVSPTFNQIVVYWGGIDNSTTAYATLEFTQADTSTSTFLSLTFWGLMPIIAIAVVLGAMNRKR